MTDFEIRNPLVPISKFETGTSYALTGKFEIVFESRNGSLIGLNEVNLLQEPNRVKVIRDSFEAKMETAGGGSGSASRQFDNPGLSSIMKRRKKWKGPYKCIRVR
jgi:hypothetical protein